MATGRFRAVLALALGVAALFALRPLLPDRLPLGGDFAAVHLADALANRSALLAGRLPLWDPLLLCGHPHLAMLQPQLLYPGSLLLLVLPAPAALQLLFFLHLLALGGGTFLLARALGRSRSAALLAAIAAQLTPLVASITWSTILFDALCLAPWPVAFAVRALRTGRLREAALAGLALTLVFLAGSPEVALAAGLATVVPLGAAIVRDRRRGALLLGAATSVALLTSGLQLLPFLELLAGSDRAAGLDPAEAASWALGLPDLLRVLLPFPFPDQLAVVDDATFHGEQHLFRSLYAGAPLLLLAVLAPRTGGRRRLLAVMVVGLLLLASLGPGSPLFALLRALPGLRSIRYVAKLGAVALLALPLLAAFGLDGLRRTLAAAPPLRLSPSRVGLALGLGLGLPSAAWLLSFALGASALVSVSLAWVALLAAVLAGLAALLRGPRARLLPLACGLLVIVDLSLFQLIRPPFEAEPAAPFLSEAALSREARGRLAGGRLLPWVGLQAYFEAADRGAFWRDAKELAVGNRPAEDGIPLVLGFRPLELDGLTRLLEADSRTASRVLGARLHAAQRQLPGLVPVEAAGLRLLLQEDPGSKGRAFVVERARTATREEIFAEIGRGRFDPYAEVLLEREPGGGRDPAGAARPWEPGGGGPASGGEALEPGSPAGAPGAGAPPRASAGEARFLLDEPEHVELEVHAPAGGFLVLADSFAPGWEARLGDADGAEVEILRADGYVRAVPVSAGRSVVRFDYRPASVTAGAIASAAGLLLSAALLGRGRRRWPGRSRRGGA